MAILYNVKPPTLKLCSFMFALDYSSCTWDQHHKLGIHKMSKTV